MIFVAYELNLPLNMEKPHYRSQRAGEWGLIWAHDSRPIYRALTYIAVPLLGPHQPRYIGLTLYLEYFLGNWPQLIATKPHWRFVNTGSGNGLVPSGTKPLPEPVLTHSEPNLCHYMVSLGHNELGPSTIARNTALARGRRAKQPEVGTDLPWRLAAHCWLHCIFGHGQHL